MTALRRSTWALLALLATRGSAAAGSPPVFRVSPDTLHADETGYWHADLTLQNTGPTGIYLDSLFVDWVSADPDSGLAPRRGTTSLDALSRVVQPAGTGETTGVQWSAPADFENGSLVFRLRAHDAQKDTMFSSYRVVVAGSALIDRYPPQWIPVGGSRIEMVILPADSTASPAPAVLYVPPAGVGARSTLRWARLFVERGYASAVLSLPGWGRSGGRPDRAGPTSVAAVDSAIRRLVRAPGVDPKLVLVWGLGEGATCALLAAARHPELAGVIAQDATFDPWAAYRAMAADQRAAYVREAGADSAAWRARSPLAGAVRVPPPVLLLQTGEAGAPASAGPAQAYERLRTGQGLYVEARINGQQPAPFMRRDAQRVALDFMARRTRHP
jgi:pimeloyl-ACP methyl ester carboxylesterase